jgi:phosphatidylglycerophosphatase A
MTEAKKRPLAATVIATSFGAGFVPRAPGHSGTLTAVPLAWALAKGGDVVFIAGLVAVSLVGWWAAEMFGRYTGREDDQRIVIDEVAGYLMTLVLVPRSGVNLVLAFLLFRLFDVTKPPPVRQLDRHIGGGLGVMVDDLAAGVYAGAILFALQHFGVSARLGELFAAWVSR